MWTVLQRVVVIICGKLTSNIEPSARTNITQESIVIAAGLKHTNNSGKHVNSIVANLVVCAKRPVLLMLPNNLHYILK